MRLIGLLIVVLLLGGCAVVVSDTPWFSETDTAGAAPLRPGVWSISTDPNCRVKPKARLGHWPKCADIAVFRASDVLTLEGADKPDWLSRRYILSASDPRMLQMAPGQDRSGATTEEAVYTYLSAVPTAKDQAGRIVEFRTYFVFCDGKSRAPVKLPATVSDAAPVRTDKPAKSDEAGAMAAPAEPIQASPPKDIEPLPGLQMRKDGGCFAESKEALLNAARVSQDDETFSTVRWVRDGER